MLNLKNRRYIANRLCPDIRGQDQSGRFSLAGTALFATSAVQEAVVGEYKKAFTDLALSVTFLGSGPAALGRAIPTQAAALLGRSASPAVVAFSSKVVTGGTLVYAAARGVEKATGENPLSQLAVWSQSRLPGNDFTKHTLNMMDIALTVGSFADPKRAALWVATGIAMNLTRGKVDAVLAPGSVAGQLGVMKNQIFKEAPEAAEKLRKAYLSGVLGELKLPPEVVHLLSQASAGAVDALRRDEETYVPALRCLQGLEDTQTRARCLQDAGLSQGD